MLTLPVEYYDRQAVEDGLGSYVFTGQLEEGGDTGYRHWQIYIENDNPIKFETLRSKFPKGHFEVRKGTRAQCWNYVHKLETAVVDEPRVGSMAEPPSDKAGDRSADLERLRSRILLDGDTARDLVLEEPAAAGRVSYLKELEHADKARRAQSGGFRQLHVEYLYGDPGVGKTRSIYDKHGFDGQVFSVSSYRNPFDAYNYEPVLLLDEFAGQIEFEFLLKLLDGYPLQLPCRYADRWALFSTVYLVSNLSLASLYEDQRAADNPGQWNALCRRISSYKRMLGDGSVVEVALPVRP